MKREKESTIQIRVATHFKELEERLGSFSFFHVANGELRNKRTAAKLRAMGVKSGVHDLIFLGRGGKAIFIELKRKGNTKPSPNQEKFHALITKLGFASFLVIATDGNDAIDTITAILKAHGVI